MIWTTQEQITPTKPVAKALAKQRVLIFFSGRKGMAILLSIVSIVMISFYLITEFQQSNYAVLNRQSTETATIRSLVLSDGTQVKLNAGSTIRYPKTFSGQFREVYLEGEAFFDIAPSNKQFVIHGRDANVTTKAAKLNFLNYDFLSVANVQVYKGEAQMVSHLNRKHVYKVDAEHELFYSDENKEWSMKHISHQRNWPYQELHIDNLNLKEAIVYINLIYGTSIEIEPRLFNCKFSFHGSKPESVILLNTLATTLNLDLIKKGRNFLLKGQACQK